jgi:hypothetical protein
MLFRHRGCCHARHAYQQRPGDAARTDPRGPPLRARQAMIGLDTKMLLRVRVDDGSRDVA